MLYADMRIDSSSTYITRLNEVSMESIASEFQDLETKALSTLRKDYGGDVAIVRSADMRYVGQNFEVRTPLPTGVLNENSRVIIGDNFDKEHRRLYGHSKPGEPIEIVTLRVAVIGPMQKPVLKKIGSRSALRDALRTARLVYFEERESNEKTAVYEREKLGEGLEIQGPSIVEDVDTTVVIRPGQSARVDEYGNILIRLR